MTEHEYTLVSALTNIRAIRKLALGTWLVASDPEYRAMMDYLSKTEQKLEKQLDKLMEEDTE